MTAARFNAVAYGVDDLTLGFDMEGSPVGAGAKRGGGITDTAGKDAR